MQVQPYLFFDGRCEEAIEFYKRALGATDARVMRFKDNPEPPKADCAPSGSAACWKASCRTGASCACCTGRTGRAERNSSAARPPCIRPPSGWVRVL